MEPDKLPAAVVINGGSKITVHKLDGTTEEVRVRLIPLSKMVDYLNRVGDITLFAELVCEQSPGWADTLSFDSIYQIDELARAINDPSLARYVKRQTAAVGQMKDLVETLSGLTNSLPRQ